MGVNQQDSLVTVSTAKEVARLLLELGCVRFSPQAPFRYASGLFGPIYCDNRQIMSHVKTRNLVINHLEQLAKMVEEKFPYDLVAGLATAGIPHAAWCADRLQYPMIYIRSSAKDHGAKKLIEGTFQAGQKVVLVEDLVNQASSVQKALDALRDQELSAVATICIVSYDMPKARQWSEQFQVPIFGLTNFYHLKDEALAMGKIDRAGHQLLEEWHAGPEQWSGRHAPKV